MKFYACRGQVHFFFIILADKIYPCLQKLIFLLAFIGTCHSSLAQLSDAEIKHYLATTKFKVDTEASAVVLYERITIDIYMEGPSTLETQKLHRIIKILKDDALKEGNLHLDIYKEHYKNYTFKIEGSTYNLDNGEIKATQLHNSGKYNTKLTDDFYEISAALADVKAGSIIDYTYTLKSPFYLVLPEWLIQGKYPKLITEYSISYPQEIELNAITHSPMKMEEFHDEASARNSPNPFCIYLNTTAFQFGNCSSYWVRKNVPGSRDEPFVWNPSNQLERMDVQTVKFHINNALFLNSWNTYNQKLWSSDLAKELRKPNEYLTDTVNAIIKNDTNAAAKARSIFSYVRDHFSLDKGSQKPAAQSLKLESGIKKTFYGRAGNTAQVNALLAAMLGRAGLKAYLLATGSTDEIPASPQYPIWGRLGYFACALRVGNSFVPLDATDRNNVFGILPTQYYNGYARVISKEGAPFELTPAHLNDVNTSAIKVLIINDSTKEVEYTKKLGVISSMNTRKSLAAKDEGLKPFFEKFVAQLDENATIKSIGIDNLGKPDTNLVLKVTYTASLTRGIHGTFINTSFPKILTQNPFAAATRDNPIEFPCKSDDSYHLTILLPKGYRVGATGGNADISLYDGDLQYTKDVSYFPEMNALSVNINYKKRRASYESTSYEKIKEFYSEVIKEESRVIEAKP